MSDFFINRPIFSWVLAIIIMMAGLLALLKMPVEQYPNIAPPSVSISTSLPGASAKTLESSVTQVIEQSLIGIDSLRYFSSSSDSDGNVNITLTFEPKTNPDIAQVQVQNKLQGAIPLLPQEVQQQGIRVNKANNNFLLVVGIYSKDDSVNQAKLGDILLSDMKDTISRINGVGNVTVFGNATSMRIWVNPDRLFTFSLTIPEVITAIKAQNTDVSSGQLGGLPSTQGQQINATITSQSKLQTVEEFENIIIKVNKNGSQLRLKDVAKVELGSQSYSTIARYKRHPATGMAVILASGANALDTAKLVKDKVEELKQFLPKGVEVIYPIDSTPFIKLSIKGVVITLFEAIILVFLVMLLFLQNFRATLIPTIAVPVVLLGTFGILFAFGFTINTLTMFATVLAIGLLVDDAIVVVENVERIIHEEGLSPIEATKKSMKQITGALIGIAMVLSAVFIPMAFFGGSAGAIYRQFSVTIVSAMALSVLVALILSPSLCATILKSKAEDKHALTNNKLLSFFNSYLDKSRNFYVNSINIMIGDSSQTTQGNNELFASSRGSFDTSDFGKFSSDNSISEENYSSSSVQNIQRSKAKSLGTGSRKFLRYFMIYVVMIGGITYLFIKMPTSFLPTEDQGTMYLMLNTPSGSTLERTQESLEKVEDYFLNKEQNVEHLFTVAGFSFAGRAQNAGFGFVGLKDWSERKSPDQSVAAISGRAMGALSGIKDAFVFTFFPPPIRELGNASGFDLQLLDRSGIGHDGLMNARNQLLGMSAKNPKLIGVRPNGLNDVAQYNLNIDYEKAAALQIPSTTINQTLQAAWGSSYVNDFLDRGRIKKVYLQAEDKYRMSSEDFGRWYVKNNDGKMVSFDSFSSGKWTYGSPKLERFNGNPSINIQGSAIQGVSSGDAMNEMEQMIKQLPNGIDYAWQGLSYEEKLSGKQTFALYALSLVVVFLSLAALYESWTIPFSVILVVPFGIFGALLFSTLKGMSNDVYFQVGLLTTIGLSAKNAILIVEFAKELYDKGHDLIESTIIATKQRFRPILMTSMAFILGITPLATASGAGSASQRAIGVSVMGGMFAATFIATLFVPMFFVMVQKMVKRKIRNN